MRASRTTPEVESTNRDQNLRSEQVHPGRSVGRLSVHYQDAEQQYDELQPDEGQIPIGRAQRERGPVRRASTAAGSDGGRQKQGAVPYGYGAGVVRFVNSGAGLGK